MKCDRCHEDKPITAFAATGFAYLGRERSRRKTCRACLNAAKRGKVCPGCKRYRARRHFYTDVRKRDGLQTECKACHKARRQHWTETHRPQWNAYSSRLQRLARRSCEIKGAA